MIKNPVYNKEITVSSRGYRIPAVIAIFNLILAAVALISMGLTVRRAEAEAAAVDYASFLLIFRMLACIEFGLILFIMPSLTAGSISAERERGTLDLMLTTRLTPLDIAAGKLLSAVSTAGMILLSSLPVLALVFAYGGLTVSDVLVLVAAFLTEMVLTGCVGLWTSARHRNTAMAAASAYGILGACFGAGFLIPLIVRNLTGNAGLWFQLLYLNPSFAFLTEIFSLTGYRNAVSDLARWLGSPDPGSPERIFLTGILLQLLCAAVLFADAVRHIGPGRRS